MKIYILAGFVYGCKNIFTLNLTRVIFFSSVQVLDYEYLICTLVKLNRVLGQHFYTFNF